MHQLDQFLPDVDVDSEASQTSQNTTRAHCRACHRGLPDLVSFRQSYGHCHCYSPETMHSHRAPKHRLQMRTPSLFRPGMQIPTALLSAVDTTHPPKVFRSRVQRWLTFCKTVWRLPMKQRQPDSRHQFRCHCCPSTAVSPLLFSTVPALLHISPTKTFESEKREPVFHSKNVHVHSLDFPRESFRQEFQRTPFQSSLID